MEFFPWELPIVTGHTFRGPNKKPILIRDERDFYLYFEYKGSKKLHGYRIHNILRARRAEFRKEKKAWLNREQSYL